MFLPLLSLIGMSIALIWTVLSKGGVYPSDFAFTVLGLGVISLLYWVLKRKRPTPSLSRWLVFSLVAFPLYLIFQLIPLPIHFIGILSPARARLISNLDPVLGDIQYSPLSTAPVQTAVWLTAVLTFIATFLLVRQLAWRWNAHPWIVLTPLLFISSLESLIGISQAINNLATGTVTGTYTNHDHFAGSLEMTLPIAVLYGAAVFRNGRKAGGSAFLFTAIACFLWGLAGLFLVAISYSLSRMGFMNSIAVLFSIGLLVVAFYLKSRMGRFIAIGGLLIAGALVVLVLPSHELLDRFNLWVPVDNQAAEMRPYLWRDTLPLIAEFPAFGCGMGGFESNFMKYQTVGKNYEIQFAHNDYLDFLADLGYVGFGLMLAVVIGVLQQIFAGLSRQPDESRRFLQIACGGSMIAILLHSVVDFNMHIPANAMTLAWIAGVGSIGGFRNNRAPKLDLT